MDKIGGVIQLSQPRIDARSQHLKTVHTSAITSGSPQDDPVLAALTKFFIAHIPHTHNCMPGKTDAFDSSSAISDVISEAGSELLHSLKKFLVVIMCSHDEICTRVTKSHKDNLIHIVTKPAQMTPPKPIFNNPQVPKVIHHHAELPSGILKILQRRVFSVMPTRLLAINVTEDRSYSISLIERNEIFRRSASKMQQALQLASHGSEHIHQPDHWVRRHTGYVILSHTWMRDIPGEVIYKNWATRRLNTRGYAKIANFCKVAITDYNIDLAWIDSACINKDSSSELDESIRSMYKWYRIAEICVAYLSETSCVENMHLDTWFTRGWTFQELVATPSIRFYGSDWTNLCNTHGDVKSAIENKNITSQIERATGITPKELQYFQRGDIASIPISRRMQMASHRQVTREEDESYALMGILRVNISIAYGEGRDQAFFRLVRELVSKKEFLLDLFNCSHQRYKGSWIKPGLLPSDIRQYHHRSTNFDFDPDTAILQHACHRLSAFRPTEPIVLTHLGLRAPLILSPALRMEHGIDFKNYNSLGDIFGVAVLHESTTRYIYALSHSAVFQQPIKISNQREGMEKPKIATFGIMNFAINDDVVEIPSVCLSVPLYCGGKVGNVTSSDRISVIESDQACVFKLQSKVNPSSQNNQGHKVYRIPKAELSKYGLQLATLYIR